MRALLLSSSTVYGSGYLDYAEEELRSHLAGVSRVLSCLSRCTTSIPTPLGCASASSRSASRSIRFTRL
jgi:hypothetical protein